MKKIILLTTLLLLAAALPARKALRIPRFLKPGDKVAIISPSSCPDSAVIDTGAATLRRWGFEPVVGRHVLDNYRTYAGTLEARKSDLLWALQDPSIKAVVCSRGGQGFAQLLCEIPLKTFRKQCKWVVGFSDITAFLSAQVCAGNMAIHANMCSSFDRNGVSDSANNALRLLLLGKMPSYVLPPHIYNRPGEATGILVGGNMSVYGGLAGSDYDFLKTKDIVLFIEDVGEGFYSVDRMFHLLKVRGVLDRVRGLIVGRFNDYKDSDGLGYKDMYQMLDEHLSRYNLHVPVCFGFPVGHGEKNVNYPLVEGSPVTLKVSSQGTVLSFGLEGTRAYRKALR